MPGAVEFDASSPLGHAVALAALHANIRPKAGAASKFVDGTQVVTGSVAVLRQIGRPALLGDSPAAEAEVDEWLEAVAVDAKAAVARLGSALATRTFLAGYSFSVADVALFAAAKAVGGDLSSDAHVSRWASMCSTHLPIAAAEKLVGGGSSASTAPAKEATPAAAPAAAAAAASGSAAPAAAEGGAGGKKVRDLSDADAKRAAAIAAKAALKAAGGDPAAASKGEGKKSHASAPLAKTAADEGNIGGGGSSGSMPKLLGAKEGTVVTRFPPEPSGFLHIGHAKALLLNDYYAKAYKGKLLIRFDDTNPSKEKEEFEEAILSDLRSLGVAFESASISHTSDHFPFIEDEARRMIKEGKAYMDDTPREEMQRQRTAREDSKYRLASTEENMARFELMLQGSEEGGKWCLRARMNMQDDNGTCRDPVLYRANLTPHHRTGTKYKAYPTYDFACPIVDALEGVTHALRSSEYHDRDEQFYRLQDMLGCRRVVIQDFARLNFVYTLLSKRKLTWFVENGKVEGWNDPRFPTVQGILRRGLVVPALRDFILSQGASKRIIEMEWDKLWSTNKRFIDPVAPRFTALSKDAMIPFDLSNGPASDELKTVPLHPKNADVGVKTINFTRRIFLDLADVSAMKEGEEITVMKWGNAIVRKIHTGEGGKILRLEGELHLAGDVKSTEKKVNWLPSPVGAAESSGMGLVEATLIEFDYLIKVPNLDEGDDFMAALNPVTKLETAMLGEPAMRACKPGDIVQLERRCYARCDKAWVAPDRPAVFFLIPDGKVKGLFGLADRVKA